MNDETPVEQVAPVVKEAKNRHAPASYPAASLSLCLRKASLSCESDEAIARRDWVSQEDFAKACGYKGFEGNSAPKGLIAALAHFGLIERDAQKRVRLSQELRGSQGSESARAELIAKAIRRPKAHQALLSVFGAQAAPSKSEIAKNLMERMNFAQRPAQIMASNFQEDLALLRSVEPLSAASGSHAGANGEFVERIIAPSGAELSIVSSKPLNAQDWGFIERYMRLKAESAH